MNPLTHSFSLPLVNFAILLDHGVLHDMVNELFICLILVSCLIVLIIIIQLALFNLPLTFLITVNLILTLTIASDSPRYVVPYWLDLSRILPIHNAFYFEIYNEFFHLEVDCVLQINEGTPVFALCDLDIFLITVNLILTLTVAFDKPLCSELYNDFFSAAGGWCSAVE